MEYNTTSVRVPPIVIILMLLCLLIFYPPFYGQTQIEQDLTKKVEPQRENTVTLLNPQDQVRRINIPQNISQIQQVTVPVLVERRFNLNEIVRILDRSGLQMGEAIPVINQRVGVVLTQYPVAGTRVRSQTVVNITYGIEKPPTGITPTTEFIDNVTVINYVGMTEDRAFGRMPNDRVTPGGRREVHSDEPSGIVVDQFPAAGTIVDLGTRVSLLISMGPPEVIRVQVPRLLGLTLQEAAEVLRESELFVGDIGEQSSDEKEGIIIRQLPRPGTEVLKGFAVDIAYSIHARETLIPVPNVRKLFRDEAIRVIKENRLNYLIEYVNEPGHPAGVVINQNPIAETMVPVGAEVFILIQDDSVQIPPWMYWGGGMIVAGLLGGFIGRKIKPGKRKKTIAEKDISIDLKPVWDIGKQTITSNEKEIGLSQIHLKCIPDLGNQTLKIN